MNCGLSGILIICVVFADLSLNALVCGLLVASSFVDLFYCCDFCFI